MIKKKWSWKQDIQRNQDLQRYYLASAGSRLLARFLDFLFLFFLTFFVGVAFFQINLRSLNITYTQLIPMLFGHNLNLFTIKQLSLIFIGWKYCVFSWYIFLLFSFWFLVIPFLWKGRTIGKAICKITTFNLSENNRYFFWRLVQKESLIWILMSVIFVIYGFVCLALKTQAYKFNISYIQHANTNGFLSFSAIYVFVFLFSMCALIQILLILWMCFKNHKPCLQDDMSNTVVIFTTKFEEKIQKQEKGITYDKKKEQKFILPGEIDVKEIDKLTKMKK